MMDDTLSRRIGLGLRRADDPAPPAAPPRRVSPHFGHNAFASDPVLGACLDASLDEETEDQLKRYGAYWGSPEAAEVARIAADHAPCLRREDFEGRRIDQVEVHPAYHALMNRSVNAGLLSSAWEDGEGTHQHRLRAATLYITAGCERGHLLPISATHAAIASLAYAPKLEGDLFPLLASKQYDRRQLPPEEKDGLTITLATNERNVGGEYGEIYSRGELLAGDAVRLSGEKVYVAAPTADFLLVMTRTADGPTAALVPQYSQENASAIAINALADYGGLQSQAIASMSFIEARGRLIGEPGRGYQVLRDVRTLTQLDAAIIVSGGTRAALARAAHTLRTRQAGGAALLGDPLHARVMADLALTSAAQTALTMRLAGAFDRAFERDGDHAVARILTPAARLYAFETASITANNARELMGLLALPRQHPVARTTADISTLAQWDSAANDAALDLVGVISRDENVLPDALDEIGADLGNQNGDLVDRTLGLGREAVADASLARAFAYQFAMVGAASAMRRNLPRVVSDAFIASRLRSTAAGGPGALESRFDAGAILEFILPED